MRTPDRSSGHGKVRCAIYTRKSSDEGLEQEFNSLDAQREACAAYIASQRHAGWTAAADMYDDGGLSGGTMERPALQRLLADIQANRVQIVVVYKVDRLTRSLADFAKIVDIFDGHGASFVSVTQQFNTTTSMGRLTLNMLLSFAQFEREIAGERIRDKIAASKAKGMWMGGNVPLGYDIQDRKLIINNSEADTVRLIFRRYSELGSVTLLRKELAAQGIVSKKRKGVGGRLSGGQKISRGALYLMLQNRIYCGEIKHKGNAYPGQHEAIIELDLWRVVQDKLATNRQKRALGLGAESPSLLAGLIVDSEGQRLTPTHANKRGKRYRYYISMSLLDGRRGAGQGTFRLPAGEIEGLVLDRLRAFLASRSGLAEAMAPFDLSADALEAALHHASQLAARWQTLPSAEVMKFVRSSVERVSVATDHVEVIVDGAKLLNVLGGGQASKEENVAPIVLSIAANLRRAGKGKRLVIAGNAHCEIDANLIALLKQAFATRAAFLSGADDSLSAMTERLGTGHGQLVALVRLSYLAPDLIRDCIEGRQPVELTPTRLLKLGKDLPHDWSAQRTHLGFAR
ncbi:recombinase family protein [Hyphomicrobium sp. MC1]|uniref:recombinase family protein n=1 Tax=Hyphomicrobium sp. (strain MC1) TaxID=717785 RepID=UPI000213E1EC|nr:recombinase family protein [Hyphomicrobium sp. MC1]CCB66439.1 putative resolvase [Hyphomicrobium sp. MC1]